MRAFGEDILEKKIIEKILITMPQKFDPIVTMIEETKDPSTLSKTELVRSLEVYEQRLYRHKEDTLEKAFHSLLQKSLSTSVIRVILHRFSTDVVGDDVKRGKIFYDDPK